MTGGLAALLLLVPIVLAYRWSPPRARRVVPALVLLRRLQPGTVVARRSRRIEDLLLLALLCAALTALVVGLVRPRDDRPAILVLDTSASMGAFAGDGTRLGHARAGMREWLTAHPDAPAGLLVTSQPALALSPTLDRPRVREVIARVETGADRDWTALAKRSCRDARLVIASDGPFEAPAACESIRLDLGAASPNAGLVAVAVRPTDALGGIEITVESAGTDGPVALVGGGETLATLPAGEAVARVTAPLGAFTVAIPGGDALRADDQVGVPRTPLVRVVLVTTEAQGFTARALGAHPGVTLQVAAPADPLPAEADVVVVEDPPSSTMPTASVTVWLGTAEGSGFAVAGRADEPEVRASPSAWVRYVDPSAIHVASSLVFAPGPTVVLDSSKGPLAVARDAEGRRVLALGFGPRTSDLGLDVAFLHLLANAVDATRPGAAAVEGLLSRTETLATPPPGTAAPRSPIGWRAGAVAALCCLLAEGFLTHLRGRR